MAEAIITLPDGRKARITGPTREAIMQTAREMSGGGSAQSAAPPLPSNFPGLIERGNIDLKNRPIVQNDDGSISTVRSMSANFDGVEVLIPTVSEDGRILSNEQAINQFRRTGRHLGKFKTPEAATQFAEALHNSQDRLFSQQARMMPTLGHRRGINPNSGRFNQDLAVLDDLMSNPPPRPEPSSGFDVVKEFAQGRRLPNNPLVLATIGSIGFPPLAAGRATTALPGLSGILSRTAQRFAPPVLASSGIGGTVAGIEESQRPGSTPASIAKEGITTGAKLGAAELAGLGLTTAAAKVVAPRLGFLDPLKGFRKQFGAFVKTVPERTRAAAKRVQEMLPEGGAQNAAQSIGETAVNASNVVKELVKQNALGKAASGAAKTFGQRQKTAAAVAKALGERTAKRFGFNEREGSQRFLFNVWRSGNEQALKTLRKRLGAKSFEDFQLQNLSALISRASRRGPDGELRLDGDRLKQLWDDLPEASRAIYSPGAQRAIESLATFGSVAARVARFAATPTGSEIAEAILTPLAFAAGGPALGIPIMVARQLLFPGPLTRFLTRDKLPNEVVQMIGGQAVKGSIRAGLTEETDDR